MQIISETTIQSKKIQLFFRAFCTFLKQFIPIEEKAAELIWLINFTYIKDNPLEYITELMFAARQSEYFSIASCLRDLPLKKTGERVPDDVHTRKGSV